MYQVLLAVLSLGLLVHVNQCKPKDWLITDVNNFPAVTLSTACEYNGFKCIELSNSLISRKFITTPNFFTIEYNSHLTSTQTEYALRSPFSPEAVIGINNQNYSIGGVSYVNNTDTTAAFWDPSFLSPSNLQVNTSAWTFVTYSTSTTCNKLYDWTPGTRSSFEYIAWPPKGLQLNATFKAPASAPSVIRDYLTVTVQYEMYQGMPLLSKKVYVESSNTSATSSLQLTYVQVEQLKLNLPYGVGESDWDWGSSSTNGVPFPGKLWIELDIPKGTTTNWFQDPDRTAFKHQNYGGYEAMLTTSYEPASEQTQWSVRLAPELPGTEDGVFASFRTFELFFDDYDLERQGLARRRMMSYMSPTLTEAPVYTQTINMTDASLDSLLEQCAYTGFEILAFSFDSGFDMETTNQSTLDYYKSIVARANALGIEIGGYDLIVMGRNVTGFDHVEVDGSVKDGLCLASGWVEELTQYYNNFVDYCGASMFITDGPYPGWSCASTEHKYHDGLADSVYRNTWLQNEWYLYYRNKGVYIHSPDSYYYYGINKNKYPYSEFTTTLPRWWDLTVYRQLMYDNSYRLPVTAGWMFLPMSAYHGGNSDAVFAPVSEHYDDYSFALGQYFSYGVAATIRGQEIYDSDATRDMVRNWVSYYKKYRSIIISDVIHVARPNNLNIDAILHVNHMLEDYCGMLIVFNPLNNTLINQTLDVNLYYTGARDSIMVKREEQEYKKIELYDDFYYTFTFDMPPRNLSYWLFHCV